MSGFFILFYFFLYKIPTISQYGKNTTLGILLGKVDDLLSISGENRLYFNVEQN